MVSQPEPGDETMAGDEMKFKTGNICRIYIRNFLTFNEVEVRPKPKLNFVCGANGSGKSTILCAIYFCLGGSASGVGRGKEVYHYVKTGKAEATLEVEVFVKGEINAVITYKINQQIRQCKWYLQGREVTPTVVKRRIEKLNIQVENLCQFLPQDKVVSFATMNCQQLLVATERAVGEPSLHEEHMTLCNSGQVLTTLQQSKKELQESVAQAERKNARLKDIVENLEVKAKLEKELKDLNTQKAWYLYDHKRKIHDDHKEKLNKKEQELNSWKRKMEPAMQTINDKIKKYSLMKKTTKAQMDSLLKRQNAEQNIRDEFDGYCDNLRDAKCNYESKVMMEEQRQNEIEDYKRQLEVLLGQLQNLPEIDQEEAIRRLRDLTDNIQKTSQKIVRLQGQSMEMVMNKDKKVSNLREDFRELKSIEDLKGRRMELLKSHNLDAFRATQWLQHNRDSFNGPVYPPLCLLLNIKNEHYARYVENHIRERDLVAFVCQDKDDVNLLKQEMDRQRIKVNIVYASSDSLQRFKPAHSITEIRRYGFDTYMLDCIDAPPPILSFLCQNYNIHSVPIGRSGDYDGVPPSIRVFYMGDYKYSRSVSRYDGQVSTSIFPLGAFKLLKINQDMERIANIKARIEDLQQKIKKDEELIKGIKEEEDNLTKSLETWRNEKRALAARREERKALDQRILHKRNQIAKHEEEAVDLEEAKTIMTNSVKEHLRNQVKTITKLRNSMEETSSKICDFLKVEGKAKVMGLEVKALERNAEDWKAHMGEMQAALYEMKKELKKHKLEGRDALTQLKNALGIDDISEITTEIRDQFKNSSLEMTERQLAEKEAHLSCLSTASKSEVIEYKQGQRELSRLQESLEDVNRTLEAHHQDLGNLKESWLPRITQLVADINAYFSHFMSRMGCSGQVVLHAKGDDFSQYGMALMVRFRKEQHLYQLTAHKQSGGERAVSTALYLLALQSLTSAPFRCVDEINQGMDKINERKMLQMLVETEANEKCSQYFFVTPKLLQNVQFTKNVTVMIVFNSPTSLTHRHLALKRTLKRKEEANRRKKAAASQV